LAPVQTPARSCRRSPPSTAEYRRVPRCVDVTTGALCAHISLRSLALPCVADTVYAELFQRRRRHEGPLHRDEGTATCNMHHAPCNMQHTTRTMRRIRCATWPATHGSALPPGGRFARSAMALPGSSTGATCRRSTSTESRSACHGGGCRGALSVVTTTRCNVHRAAHRSSASEVKCSRQVRAVAKRGLGHRQAKRQRSAVECVTCWKVFAC
jgi:hypothetical protein